MPHDKNGKVLEVGDMVVIHATVSQVSPQPEFCNINLVTVEPMPPYSTGTTIVLNTLQVEKVEDSKVEYSKV